MATSKGDAETVAARLDSVFGRLTNDEVAEKITAAGTDASKELVRRYRGGHAERITAEFVSAAARAFRVNPTWLLTGEGERTLPSEDGNGNGVRSRIHAAEKAADDMGADVPTLARLDWLPELLREIARMTELTGAERQGLMAEANAGAMRYWALAAEWSSGQRGIAMTRAEEASGERARANGEEAKSATARALSINRDRREEFTAAERDEATKEARKSIAADEGGEAGKRKAL